MKDNTMTECQHCHKGWYKEASVMDDIQGVLHCTHCHVQVPRYSKEAK